MICLFGRWQRARDNGVSGALTFCAMGRCVINATGGSQPGLHRFATGIGLFPRILWTLDIEILAIRRVCAIFIKARNVWEDKVNSVEKQRVLTISTRESIWAFRKPSGRRLRFLFDLLCSTADLRCRRDAKKLPRAIASRRTIERDQILDDVSHA